MNKTFFFAIVQSSLFYPEDGNCKLFRNVHTYPTNYAGSHLRREWNVRPSCLYFRTSNNRATETLLWEP